LPETGVNLIEFDVVVVVVVVAVIIEKITPWNAFDARTKARATSLT
jgi:hypothetical protein